MLQEKRMLISPMKFINTNAGGSLTFTAIIFVSLLTAALFSSCNGAAKQAEKKNAGTATIQLTAASAITAIEIEKYKMSCERWYDTVLKNKDFDGGILVAKKGNIVFENYSGTGHINGKDTVTSTTPFHIASVSKTFTAMATLKFWQDGKLNLDEELSKYFPAFNYPGVTIRTLLNHRSGLPNYVYFMETLGWDKKTFIQNEDVLNYLITRKAELKNIAPPNTHFNYCNTNYALLALLLEKISGTKFPDLLKQLFFTPLQMKNTFVFDSSMIKQVNPSYDWRGRIQPFNFLDAVYGDKNIYTTPRDLLIWDNALSSGKIFTEKTLQEAFAPYSNEKPGVRNYGLGWRMNIYPNGKKMIYHNGWWHGNNASFIRLIQDSATIIVLSNKFNRGVYHAKDMANIFGDYGGAMEEEEETNASAKPVTANGLIKDSLAPVKKALKNKKRRR